MHAVTRALAGIGAGALLLSIPLPAVAGPPGKQDAQCDLYGGTCDVSVSRPGAPGSSARDSRGGGGPTGRRAGAVVGESRPDSCRYVLYDPQPPKSDPIWDGRTTGAIYSYICEEGQDFVAVMWRGAPPAAAGEPTKTPAELAQQARDELTLPNPVVHRSPTEKNKNDDGIPYTWVHLWTWYWTSPASWRELSKTASADDVWATVTVTPIELSFDPGNGQEAVSCPGPGRAWTRVDGDAPPSNGGCGYWYPHVSGGVESTVSIRWAVTWTGSGGTGGQLPDMTSQTISPVFAVEQNQVVNR
jgi:hypothetical protein